MTRGPGGLRRAGWLSVGLVCTGIGGVGVVVPGLPTTVFFIAAAACFARSSPRLERWLLGLPGVGQMVRDHRDGLGMPRRAKVAAIITMVGFSLLAIVLLPNAVARIVIAVAAVAGSLAVALVVPTRERVLERRAAAVLGE